MARPCHIFFPGFSRTVWGQYFGTVTPCYTARPCQNVEGRKKNPSAGPRSTGPVHRSTGPDLDRTEDRTREFAGPRTGPIRTGPVRSGPVHPGPRSGPGLDRISFTPTWDLSEPKCMDPTWFGIRQNLWFYESITAHDLAGSIYFVIRWEKFSSL